MFNNKIEGAIDIGSSSIKGLALKNDKIDKMEIEPVQHGAILNGAIEDHLAVSDSLKKIISRLGLKGKSVVVSMPVQNFFVKFIEIAKVDDKEKKPLIDNELEDILPGYNAQNYITEYVPLASNPGREKLMIMTVQREKIKTLIEILTSVKVKPVRIVPDFVALFNLLDMTQHMMIKDLENSSIMVVDIGAEATKMFIAKNGEVKMQRVAPVGGNDFNDVIQRIQNADYYQAEEYKRKLELKDESEEDGEANDEVFQDIGELVEELNGQIKRSIEYYKIQEGVIGIEAIIITGGGGLLKGYSKVLEKKLATTVKHFVTSQFLMKKFENKDIIEEHVRRFDTLIGNVIEEVAK